VAQGTTRLLRQHGNYGARHSAWSLPDWLEKDACDVRGVALWVFAFAGVELIAGSLCETVWRFRQTICFDLLDSAAKLDKRH
jgi:hypothetical protein